jgi:hypothetical protein
MIAREVGKLVDPGERAAAKQFVLRHRLSVASAFSRGVLRGDVVKALGELFAATRLNAEWVNKVPKGLIIGKVRFVPLCEIRFYVVFSPWVTE